MSYRDRGGGGGSSRPARVSLVVRNLPLDIRVEDLRGKFEKYGDLKDVYIPRDYYTQRARGFGFVEFKESRDAEDAMYNLDRSTINGREISVTFSREGRKTPRDMMKIESRHKGHDDRYDDRRRSRSRSPRRRYSRSPRRSRSRSPRRSRSRSRERGRSPRDRSPRDRSPQDRERDYDRDRSRERDRGREGSRERDRGRERSRERDNDRDNDKERERSREREHDKSPRERERSPSQGRSPSPRRESPGRPEGVEEQ